MLLVIHIKHYLYKKPKYKSHFNEYWLNNQSKTGLNKFYCNWIKSTGYTGKKKSNCHTLQNKKHPQKKGESLNISLPKNSIISSSSPPTINSVQQLPPFPINWK